MKHVLRHLLVAAALGVLAGLLTPTFAEPVLVMRLLVGWGVAALAFSAPVLHRARRLTPEQTKAAHNEHEGGRTETDLIVTLASLASIAIVGLLLLGGKGSRPAEAALGVAAIGASWVAIHTMWSLRYSRHYYESEPGCIEFDALDGNPTDPALSDFVYLAFTLGMTYQVSDTGLRTRAVRALVLRHTLVSYLFGTVIVAATINLVVSLAG